jgi:hypothetical protein
MWEHGWITVTAVRPDHDVTIRAIIISASDNFVIGQPEPLRRLRRLRCRPGAAAADQHRKSRPANASWKNNGGTPAH